MSKKAVTDKLGKVGEIAKFAPAPQISAQIVSGYAGVNQPITGAELGAGVALGNPVLKSKIGTTIDAGKSRAVVLEEKTYGF